MLVPWATDDERRVIESMNGVLADNVANDSGDMLYSIATDDAGAVTDAERISDKAIALAAQTMGDHSAGITVIAMHSAMRTRLAINKLIEPFLNAQGQLLFETYLGKRIVIDDSLTPIVGTNRITYTSILFGAGVVSRANGPVQTPSAISREELAGNGGGQDIIHSRTNTIYHVNGFSFLSGSVAGQTATYAELALAANWDRVVNRKNVNIAFLQTND